LKQEGNQLFYNLNNIQILNQNYHQIKAKEEQVLFKTKYWMLIKNIKNMKIINQNNHQIHPKKEENK